MNFLFGLIPCLTLIAILMYLIYCNVIGWKVAFGLSGFVIFLTALLSLNTYGPRHTLDKAYMPTAPEAVSVEPGEGLIPHKDRRGEFEQKLKQAE